MLRKLLFVNLSSMLFFGKFLVLITYDLYHHASLGSLAVYSLVIGLTSSISNVAMLWGRVYVLNEIDNAAGIIKFNIVLVIANLAAILITMIVFKTFAYFDLIMLVSAVKFTENIFFANVSFIQKKVGRKFAFTLINIRSFIVILVFLLFFISGELVDILMLELFVGVSASVYLYVLVTRVCLREIRKRNLIWDTRTSLAGIVAGVTLLSICAGLNALLNTVSLAYLMNNGLEMSAKHLALIFAAFAVVTRLLFNNTLFFRHELARSRDILVRGSKIAALILTIVFIAAYVQIDKRYADVADLRDLLVFSVPIGSLIILHSLSVLLRQRILLIRKTYFLVKFHAVELLILGGILLIGSPGIEQLVLSYFLLRAMRTFAMARQL